MYLLLGFKLSFMLVSKVSRKKKRLICSQQSTTINREPFDWKTMKLLLGLDTCIGLESLSFFYQFFKLQHTNLWQMSVPKLWEVATFCATINKARNRSSTVYLSTDETFSCIYIIHNLVNRATRRCNYFAMLQFIVSANKQ